jgi:hypothetical protein
MEEGRKGGQEAKINPVSRLAIRLLFVTLVILTYFERCRLSIQIVRICHAMLNGIVGGLQLVL